MSTKKLQIVTPIVTSINGETGDVTINTTVDSSMSATSTNPVQNKVIKDELDKKFDKTGGTITGDVIATQSLAAYDLAVCIPEEYKENNFSNAVGLGISPNIPANEPLAIEFSGRYNDEDVRLAMIASPVSDNDAANKQYVDDAVANAGMPHPLILQENTDYGDTLPTSPQEGQLFFKEAGISLFDLIYPVGAVYISMNNTSPATLFGGSWTKVEGKFLLGASSSYPTGSSSTLADGDGTSISYLAVNMWYRTA